jgi:hypothetical protein
MITQAGEARGVALVEYGVENVAFLIVTHRHEQRRPGQVIDAVPKKTPQPERIGQVARCLVLRCIAEPGRLIEQGPTRCERAARAAFPVARAQDGRERPVGADLVKADGLQLQRGNQTVGELLIDLGGGQPGARELGKTVRNGEPRVRAVVLFAQRGELAFAGHEKDGLLFQKSFFLGHIPVDPHSR